MAKGQQKKNKEAKNLKRNRLSSDSPPELITATRSNGHSSIIYLSPK